MLRVVQGMIKGDFKWLFCCFAATFVFKVGWVSGVGDGGRGGGKFFCCTCCHASATVVAIVTASVFIGVWGGSGSRTVECAQDFMVEGCPCVRVVLWLKKV